MPRKRATTRRRTGALTAQDSIALRYGFPYFGGAPSFDLNDDDDVRDMWDAYGEQIMQRWREDPRRVGTRPWAWWKVVAHMDEPSSDEEEGILRELGALTREEEAELARQKAERQAHLANMRGEHWEKEKMPISH